MCFRVLLRRREVKTDSGDAVDSHLWPLGMAMIGTVAADPVFVGSV